MIGAVVAAARKVAGPPKADRQAALAAVEAAIGRVEVPPGGGPLALPACDVQAVYSAGEWPDWLTFRKTLALARLEAGEVLCRELEVRIAPAGFEVEATGPNSWPGLAPDAARHMLASGALPAWKRARGEPQNNIEFAPETEIGASLEAVEDAVMALEAKPGQRALVAAKLASTRRAVLEAKDDARRRGEREVDRLNQAARSAESAERYAAELEAHCKQLGLAQAEAAAG